MASLSKNFDFNLRRDHQKIPYERHDYELVDEKSLLLGYVPKNYEKKIQAVKVNPEYRTTIIYAHIYNASLG